MTSVSTVSERRETAGSQPGKRMTGFLTALAVFMLVSLAQGKAQQNSGGITSGIAVEKQLNDSSLTAEALAKIEEKQGDSVPHVTLSTYEYIVADTSESVSFRLYVRNNSDSLVVIDRVEPSCGCILATIQKSYVRRNHDGEIYIGLMTSRMNDWQPFTVDVYTSINTKEPLRLFIRKQADE